MLSSLLVIFPILGVATASAVFGTIGAIILICAAIPPFLETLKSKKTYGISNKFFLFYMIGGALFSIVSILIIVNGSDNGVRVLGAAMLIANIFSLIINSYMFKIKVKNMKLAKEQGLCEMDYYNNFLANSNKDGSKVSSEENENIKNKNILS